ncbi:hypothetical protein FQN49_001611 [Arthroderma sp. PD_2]|nr:hypothetical protein FQN49_001611 [Arthroderma sp. PD_2]
MCGIRTHTHRLCGCRTHHIRLCRTFSTIPPCPSSPRHTSRFITTVNKCFSEAMLARCSRLYIFPDEVDPYPCLDHWDILCDPKKLLSPPGDPETSIEPSSGPEKSSSSKEVQKVTQGDIPETPVSTLGQRQNAGRVVYKRPRGFNWSVWENS